MIKFNVSSWSFTIPLLVVFIIFKFEDTIRRKVLDLNNIQSEGAKISVAFAVQKDLLILQQASPPPGEPTMTQEEMVGIFTQYDARHGETAKYPWPVATVFTALLQSNITTKTQLERLLSDQDMRRELAELYILELGRPSNNPIDPLAIAQFGTLFFKYGQSAVIKEAVKQALRVSSEYASNHRQ